MKGHYSVERARPLADLIVSWIRGIDQKVELCGSLRRGCAMVGDIDIVLGGPLPTAAVRIEAAAHETGIAAVMLTNLDLKSRSVSMLVDGVQIDLYVADEARWAAMTLFLTGNKVFNILTRNAAKKQGYKLNQYGLWHGEELLAGRSEEQIMAALGLKFMAPADRTMNFGDQLELEEIAYGCKRES